MKKHTQTSSKNSELVDQFSRTISYLRLSLTDRCNLRCIYCMPEDREEGLQMLQHSDLLSYEELLRVINVAVDMGMNKLRLTGGEPLVRRGVMDFITALSAVQGLEEVRLTTNGVLLQEKAAGLYDAGIRKLNISLDTLRPERFKQITGVDLFQQVWQGIETAEKMGFEIKLNVVAMKGINDDELEDFIQFSRAHEVTVRFIEYLPILLNTKWKHHYISREEIVEKLSPLINSKVYPYYGKEGTPSKYFHLTQGGEAGMISPVSHGLCHNCNRLRLTADGMLKSCLVHESTINLKTALRENAGDEDIAALFKRAVFLKPEQGVYRLREATIGRNRW